MDDEPPALTLAQWAYRRGRIQTVGAELRYHASIRSSAGRPVPERQAADEAAPMVIGIESTPLATGIKK